MGGSLDFSDREVLETDIVIMRNWKKKAMEKVPVAHEMPLLEAGSPKMRMPKY